MAFQARAVIRPAGGTGHQAVTNLTSTPSSTSRRDAANSIASGIPSSRRQISTTALGVVGSRQSNASARPLCARSTNNVAAAESTPVMYQRRHRPRAVRRRGAVPRGWWPRTFTVAEARRAIDHVGTLRRGRARSCRTPAAATGPPTPTATLLGRRSVRAAGMTPSDGRHRFGHRGRDRRPRPVRSRTPRPGSRRPTRAASSSASRVLPTPPTPVSVTNRCAFSAVSSPRPALTSRPMKLVVGGRKFPGVGSTRLQRWEVGAQARRLGPGRRRPV